MANQAPGKIPGYETTYITRSELTEDALKQLQERLQSVIGTFKGEVVINEDMGKRKLAYPISKESRGQYTYVVYTGTGDVVHEVERNLRLHDHVLRFLTVNLEKEFDAEKFTKRRGELQAAAKKREEEREARREERMAERRGHYGDDRGERDYHRERRPEPSAADGTEEAAGPADKE